MKNPWIIDGQTPGTGSQSVQVSSNADKLALTGLSPGDIVVITGEGDRVEMYLGGGESSDANWLVLVNTVKLVFDFDDDFYLDGVFKSGGVSSHQVWVKEGHTFQLTECLTIPPDAAIFEYEVNDGTSTTTYASETGGAVSDTIGYAWMAKIFTAALGGNGTYENWLMTIPHNLPDRAVVYIYLET